MELEQLRQLDAIERAGTISAAAEALHMTQPSLSRSVRRLEADLGVELFERTHNRATLNDAGRLAVEHARVLLADERRMLDAFDELARRKRTVRILSVAPAPVWRVSSLAVSKFPGIILDSDMASERDVERDLINGAVDLAITLRPMQLPNLLCTPILTEDLHLFAPMTNPLSEREHVSFADLNGEAFLIYEQVGFWMDVCREGMPDSQIIVQKDRLVFEQLMNSTDLCCFATQETEGSAAMPDGATQRRSVPIVDASAHATFYLCANTGASQQVRRLFDVFREQI